MGAHPWLGFELLYLARAHQYLGAHQVRLVEVPNASASLRALAAGTLEGAGLTLDEVLSARARGLMLRVVAVFDVSDAVDANVALRIKMAESSNVYAVAMLADGRVLAEDVTAVRDQPPFAASLPSFPIQRLAWARTLAGAVPP